jgi:hypothetical protein
MGLAALACTGPAAAMRTCEGTYAATPLHPLPARMVVGIDIHDASPRNESLAQRFLAGVREAGVATGQQPNVLLHVSTSRLGGTSADSGHGAEQSFPGLSGLQGGTNPRLPAIPSTGLTAPPAAAGTPSLILRIDATEGQATRIAWVVSVQCRMIGPDEGLLAQDLGRIIGEALGKRIERRPL